VRAKDGDNRTRGEPSSHESANNRSNHSGFDYGVSRYDPGVCSGHNRSSRDVADSINSPAFFFAKSSPEIFREKTFAVRTR
jgi:hypothetical protein